MHFLNYKANVEKILICYVYDAETNERICFLNVSPDEVIRSLFYNKNNDSLITVSVYASDSFSSLKCRTTRIEYVKYQHFWYICSMIEVLASWFCLFLNWNFIVLIMVRDIYGEVNLMLVLLFSSQNLWNGLVLWNLMMWMERCWHFQHKIGTGFYFMFPVLYKCGAFQDWC